MGKKKQEIDEIKKEIEEVDNLISDLFVAESKAPNDFVRSEIEKMKRYLKGYRDALEGIIKKATVIARA